MFGYRKAGTCLPALAWSASWNVKSPTLGREARWALELEVLFLPPASQDAATPRRTHLINLRLSVL
jgi:hypothetical protein